MSIPHPTAFIPILLSSHLIYQTSIFMAVHYYCYHHTSCIPLPVIISIRNYTGWGKGMKKKTILTRTEFYMQCKWPSLLCTLWPVPQYCSWDLGRTWAEDDFLHSLQMHTFDTSLWVQGALTRVPQNPLGLKHGNHWPYTQYLMEKQKLWLKKFYLS